VPKETYDRGRDLRIWQKRPTDMAKETYGDGKSVLLLLLYGKRVLLLLANLSPRAA